MLRWLLLLHELPDHSWHYDWLIQRADSADAPLISFRTSIRPDDPAATAFPAERLPDHRPAYLTYEGPVSGDRGTVRRLASGHAEILRDDASFVVTLDHTQTWVGQRSDFESPFYQFRLSNGPWIGHTEEVNPLARPG